MLEGGSRCCLYLIKADDSVEHEDRVPHGLYVCLGVDRDEMRGDFSNGLVGMVNTAGAVECILDLGERISLAYVLDPHAVGMPIWVVGAADVHLAVQAPVLGSLTLRDRTSGRP